MDPHGGEGHVHKLGGLDTYLVGSCDSHRAVVLVSDVYGTLLPTLLNVYNCLFIYVCIEFLQTNACTLGMCLFVHIWILHLLC